MIASEGRESVRNKSVRVNRITEEINSFNCLGNLISYEKDMDIGKKN